ncbi:CPBP family intramembrane glutamic endopeptidase [Orenia metallireducens]|uniref:CPBP family intramembrane glutamic endopeptidase n=1 Tax=Orenia metallireducens TaxID=1413210 RepID=UPI001C4009F7|nr:type II CAAX endopeptidase family protein [Orenia metallireducens]
MVKFIINNKRKNLGGVLTYIVLFFIVWTIYEVEIATFIKDNYSTNIYIISRLLIKVLVWIFPVFLYLKFYDKVNPLSYLKLKDNTKRGLVGAIMLSLLFAIYNFSRVYFMGNSKLDLNLNMNTLINGIVFVGFTEEIVFRGFLLKKIWNNSSFRKAMLISSLLFLFIHYPAWFIKGKLIFPNLIFSSIYVFGFAILEAYIFKKTNSLWACIVSHSVHNFILSIL